MELPHIFRCCLMENASRIPPVRMAVTAGDGVPDALGMLFSVPVCSVFFIFHTKTRPKAVVAASGREERNEAEHQLPA